MAFAERESTRLKNSKLEVEYRRLNWRVVTCPLIRKEFQALVAQLRQSEYPIELRIDESVDLPGEGGIGINAQPAPTGAVNRKSRFDFDNLQTIHDDTAIQEEGGHLIARQSIDGHVYFIAYPRTSARIQTNTKGLTMLPPVEPNRVTASLIEKVLRRYLLVLRESSHVGGLQALSLRERVTVRWIYFWGDNPNRNAFLLKVFALENKWAYALAVALFGLMAVYVKRRFL